MPGQNVSGPGMPARSLAAHCHFVSAPLPVPSGAGVMGPAEAYRTLERCAVLLQQRIASDSRDLTYDKAELAALRVALAHLGSDSFERLLSWLRVARVHSAEVRLIGRRDDPSVK